MRTSSPQKRARTRGGQSCDTGRTYVGIVHGTVPLHHLALPVNEELWSEAARGCESRSPAPPCSSQPLGARAGDNVA